VLAHPPQPSAMTASNNKNQIERLFIEPGTFMIR
jgi:hypothetical protein